MAYNLLSLDTVSNTFKLYSVKSVDAINIITVNKLNDIIYPFSSPSLFKPVYTHQIYGDKEVIFGFRNLKIFIFYLQNSFNCFVNIQYEERIDSLKAGLVPDKICTKLSKWLPTGFIHDQNKFVELLENEDYKKMFGCTVKKFKSYNRENNYATYRLNMCNLDEPDFKDFHQRFESILVWFIDGVSKIDIDDDKWVIYYLYEENDTGSHKSPIGLCTIYKFLSYPHQVRARISQFFILPTHQKIGLGTKFFDIIYEQLLNFSSIKDITVESPSPIFTSIRDYHNCLLAFNLNAISQKNVKSGYTEEFKRNLMNICKFGKDQCEKVCNILYYVYTDTTDPDELNELKSYLKKRLSKQYKKQYWNSLGRGIHHHNPLRQVYLPYGSMTGLQESADPVEIYMKDLEPVVDKIKEYVSNN